MATGTAVSLTSIPVYRFGLFGPRERQGKRWHAEVLYLPLHMSSHTRAIHLECVSDCSSVSFIDNLTRFINRRGAPEEIISDNAGQFRLAKSSTWPHVEQCACMIKSVLSYVASSGIRWKFTTELSPWQGGFYERLVGIVKNAFKAVVGRRLLQWEQLHTFVTEIEAVVNSRPITYVYSDANSAIALRPMDFLMDLQPGTPGVDPTIAPEGGEAGKHLMKHWKYRQRRLDELWTNWHNEYQLSMRERGQT